MQTKTKLKEKNTAAEIQQPGDEPRFKSADDLVGTLENDLRARRDVFKGQTLAPYNRNYRDLAACASKDSDANSFFAWLLVFILIRGEQIYQSALMKLPGNCEAAEDEVDARLPLEVEDDIEEFRLAVRKWARHFTDDDASKAAAMLIRAKERAERAAVTVVQPEGKETTPGKSRQRRQP